MRATICALVYFACMPALAQQSGSFGPWAAGEVHQIDRQGVKGLSRAKHPVVGDPAKVPGEGPPPPAIRPDPDVPETALTHVNRPALGLSSNPLYLSALFYRHLLTKIDGPRCQHLPTCSRFANQAVARHGALGVIMGLDRLIRSSDSSSVRTLPQVEGWGSVRYLDPVDNYEFWKEEKFTGFPAKTEEKPLVLEENLSSEKKTGALKQKKKGKGDATLGKLNQVAPNKDPLCNRGSQACAQQGQSDIQQSHAVSR